MTFMIGYGSVAKILIERGMCHVRRRIRLFAICFLKMIRIFNIQTNKIENMAKALRPAETSQFDNFG